MSLITNTKLLIVVGLVSCNTILIAKSENSDAPSSAKEKTDSKPSGKSKKKSDGKKDNSKKFKKSKLKAPPASEGENPEGETKTNEEGASNKFELIGNLVFAPSPIMGGGLTAALATPKGYAFEGIFTYYRGAKGAVNYDTTHMSGRFRKSLLNVGYVAGGLGLRLASGQWNAVNINANEQYNVAASSKAIALDGGFGGHITFGKLVVSTEVLGISYPLVKLGEKIPRPEAADLDTADADNQEKTYREATGGLKLVILKLGLGLRF